jgi:hypothetical protein
MSNGRGEQIRVGIIGANPDRGWRRWRTSLH